jgi:1-aminocyclopropane-1-carboxylate deaminase/D-cysteine desulfhydrase-like pyridoxal-dependent ACC family enzyme
LLTPVERRRSIFVKRDDLFEFAGVRGGKVRSCEAIARRAVGGLVTAGSRHSPQVMIVARVARHYGLPCRFHTPLGDATPEVLDALACGGDRVAHRPGFNSLLIARAHLDATTRGWTEVPFGMECPETVSHTAKQIRNVPRNVRRIVVPVGSGMSLAGILTGLGDSRRRMPVLGVVVGADPAKRLHRWAPHNWERRVELVRCPLAYDQRPGLTSLEGIELDPLYEAKCLPFLAPDDCLWIVGKR